MEISPSAARMQCSELRGNNPATTSPAKSFRPAIPVDTASQSPLRPVSRLARNRKGHVASSGLSRQRGVGLIEVLISLVVIAIGLLGLAALQGKAQKAELESYQRSQALILLQDVAGRLRANRNGKNGYPDGASCTNSTCTADKAAWQIQLQQTDAPLNGVVCINNDNGADSAFIVSIAWQGLADITQSTENTCGQSSIGTNRRVMSIPVRFFDPGS
jgi:type IV pilus assembly protein PilV